MNDFREIIKFRPFFEVRKSSNSSNLDTLYINFKHVIWRIRIHRLFREIFKYRENMSSNRFREIHKSFLKIVKFEYFAKQLLHIRNLQITCFKMICNVFMLYESDILSNSRKWPKFRLVRENL